MAWLVRRAGGSSGVVSATFAAIFSHIPFLSN